MFQTKETSKELFVSLLQKLKPDFVVSLIEFSLNTQAVFCSAHSIV